ncbi:hypothetical protein BG011_006470 [Mortierella polycephala]|uniref:Uncharacterized protein n=1 Tax=Mortierella polycephala TaxID=41804 RepID=A0A9P6QDD0_9FUNG|nr:hypothetical protein BG011_006470 [Mortierella polycephala]
MSRYPFPVQKQQQDQHYRHQRSSNGSNSNGPNNYNNNNHANSANDHGAYTNYKQFQDGHLSTHPEDSEWEHRRNPAKQSTGSVSSYSSWTTADPAFNSNTSSYSQYQSSPQHHPLPHRHQQQQRQQQQYQQQHAQSSLSQPYRSPTHPPRSSSGRERSDSNSSDIGNNHNNNEHYQQSYTQQQHHGHANSHTNMNDNSDYYYKNGGHPGYPSQQDDHGQVPEQPQQPPQYRPQQQQQQQHQHQHQHHQQQQQQQQQQHGKQHILERSVDPHSVDGTRQSSNAPTRVIDPIASIDGQSPIHSQPQRPSHQHQESPRSGPRTQRRRDPPADNTQLPTLDDYEAMLQQMTSPNISPKDTRPARRREREGREHRSDWASGQARKQQQGQGQDQVGPLGTENRQRQRHDVTILQHNQQNNIRAPINELLEPEKGYTADRSFEERKLKRRSSLPSKLKSSPNMFSGLQRRCSGGEHPSPIIETETPKLQTLMENSNLLHDHEHTRALQEKRYSWENESIAPRVDLLENGARPNDTQRKSSWQDYNGPNPDSQLESPSDLQDPVGLMTSQQQQQQQQQQQDTSKPPLAAKSHLRLSNTQPSSSAEAGESITLSPVEEQEGLCGHHQYGQTEPPTSRSLSPVPMVNARFQSSPPLAMTEQHEIIPRPSSISEQPVEDSSIRMQQQPSGPRTLNSRLRPSTPIGVIRPPPGPAPPSAVGAMPSLARKISPNSGKRPVGSRNGSLGSSSGMLHAFVQESRPRAGSAASMTSLSSVNSFTLERIHTPPPPSSPLPSLPQSLPPPQPYTQAQLPLASMVDSGIGLGIGSHPHYNPRSKKASETDILSPRQVVLQSSNMSTGSEMNVNTHTHNPIVQITKLQKRISVLQKQLTSTEGELSCRVRNGTELQFKIDHLTTDRDSLEKKVADLESQLSKAISGASRHDRGAGASPELDRASLQLMHDMELKQAVKQVQDEKDVLFEALMERQDRSRSEMEAQMENLRAQLAKKEDECAGLRSQLIEKEDGIESLVAQAENKEIEMKSLWTQITDKDNEILSLRRERDTQRASTVEKEAADQEMSRLIHALFYLNNKSRGESE